jgi:hypothetical protein
MESEGKKKMWKIDRLETEEGQKIRKI